MKNLILILMVALLKNLPAQIAVIVGCVSGDCENAYGKYIYDDNSFYEGYFKNSTREGAGKYTDKGGSAFTGNWVNGELEGEVMCNYMNGVTFKGNYKNGSRLGFGILSWPDGTSQEGFWTNDEPTGTMTVRYPGGEKYVGEMQGVNRHGKGILYDKNGNISFNGIWIDNEMGSRNEEPAEEEKTGSDDDFCDILKIIMAKDTESFNSIRGELISTTGETFKTKKYQTTMPLPGATETYISHTFDQNYYATMGSFKQLADAEIKFNKVLEKLKRCCTDRFFTEEKPDNRRIKEIVFRRQYDDGFDQYGNYLQIFQNLNEEYEVMIVIGSHHFDGNARIYRIQDGNGSKDIEFSTNLRTIMAASYDKFDAIKGEKKIKEGAFFDVEWYELNLTLPGAMKLTIPIGDIFGEDVEGLFFRSADSMEAVAFYEQFVEKTKSALGSSYCYFVRSGSSSSTIIALEKEWLMEKTAVVSIRLWKISGKFEVEMRISYKKFGSIF